ncbi:MAG: hypothetical protein IIU96_02895 [Paludibacteraceae bacterium]|nr:hypothetical protein [Paludibacteraceae bacterium]
MNRIIIVGNGFDLAHQLATRYEDFINWYWEDRGSYLVGSFGNHIDDGLCSFQLKEEVGLAGWYYVWGWYYRISPQDYSLRELVEHAKSDTKVCNFEMHSIFFTEICKSIEEKGWVDIEAEYYRMLNSVYLSSPEKLNNEFAIVRAKLIEYLTSIQDSNINDSIVNQATRECMMAPFCANEISIEGRAKWNEFLKCRIEDENLSDIIKLYGESEASEKIKQVSEFKKAQRGQIDNMGIGSINGNELPSAILYPDRIMLLNFNYTKTADMYMPADEHHFPINHIHGHLDNPDSVIFGYGDELDNKYQEISSLNNNELLKNIKSIRYLEDVNYRNVLEFVESAPYQIYIMGHSCGTSDRTLLNTLFEHPNCVSIKPFYYQNDEGQDNYIEIVQNISRNFSNAQKMRDRVVNKTFCQPLPQRIASNE